MLTGLVAGCGWFQSGLQSGAPSFGGSDHLRLAKGCELSLVRFNSLCPWGLSPCWSCCSINWPDTASHVQVPMSSLGFRMTPVWNLVMQCFMGHHWGSFPRHWRALLRAWAAACVVFSHTHKKTTLNTYIWVGGGGGFWEVYLGLGDRTRIHPEIRAVTN